MHTTTDSRNALTLTTAAAAALSFLACIVLANWVTTEHGMISVGFGLTATAGTYFAGLTFVLRDTIQDVFGRIATAALIVTGAALSLAIAPYFTDTTFLPPGVTAMSIAVASGIAFLISELADLAVYTPLRDHGYIRAATASNVVGAVVDTLLFLWISGFGVATSIVAGQLVGKITVTAAVIALVIAVRGARNVMVTA